MATNEQLLAAGSEEARPATGGLPLWLGALLPVVLLGLMLAVFAFGNPLALFSSTIPPVEQLTVGRIVVTPAGFEVPVVNGGPAPVTVAQVAVDDAYWPFTISPAATIPRLGQATVSLAYPWVKGEPHNVMLITSSGLTFVGTVEIATETPQPGLSQFLAYGLLGVYVGIIPILLGLAWFPAMRRLGRRGLGVILALTIGLLVFLLVDTLLEALEVSAQLPAVFQGVPLVLFAALLTWLAINAVGARGRRKEGGDPSRRRYSVATLIAGGIGLHNLGEGLAIGAAFALGNAALGSFLVIGFTLHNITEGIGIAAPLTRERPRLLQLVGLALLAGSPAILGAWIGGFAYSPLMATIFLGVGTGAIVQVIVEVGRLLWREAEQAGESAVNWANVGGLTAGLVLMYGTAFLVKF